MKALPVIMLCMVGAGLVVLTACSAVPSPWSSANLLPHDRLAHAQIIQARTMGLHTLTAVLAMTFTGEHQQRTFDMIVNYDATEKMRFTAFKELGLTARPIFDLLFVGDRYRLEVQQDAEVWTYQGPVSQFLRDHPPFWAFLVIGEAFFLPGFDGFGHLPVFDDGTPSQFRTLLKSGATAQWFTKADTLEITKAHIHAQAEQHTISYTLQYSDYRTIDTYEIPGRVTLTDPQLRVTTRALLKQVEINVPLVPGVFDLSCLPKRWLPAANIGQGAPQCGCRPLPVMTHIV